MNPLPYTSVILTGPGRAPPLTQTSKIYAGTWTPSPPPPNPSHNNYLALRCGGKSTRIIPSHIACTPPTNSTLPPAIQAAATLHSHLLSSTIFRLVVAHCFDANYSNRFCPTADDITTCPCASHPQMNPHRQPRRPKQHTRDHIIFRCPLTAPHRIPRIYTLHTILQSEELTTMLCTFLKDTNSSLLCPLPRVDRPSRDPP